MLFLQTFIFYHALYGVFYKPQRDAVVFKICFVMQFIKPSFVGYRKLVVGIGSLLHRNNLAAFFTKLADHANANFASRLIGDRFTLKVVESVPQFVAHFKA